MSEDKRPTIPPEETPDDSPPSQEPPKAPPPDITPPASETPRAAPPPPAQEPPKAAPSPPPPTGPGLPPPPSARSRPGGPPGAAAPPPPPPGGTTPPRGTPPPPPPSNIRPLRQEPRRSLDTGALRQRSEELLSQLGIDVNLALRVGIVTLAAGVLAALLDEILGLPGNAMRLSFGGTLVAALCGISYAYYKGREDIPGLIMAAAAGLVAYLVWFIVKSILGFAGWEMNVFKAALSGAVAGLIGFGWLAVLHLVEERLHLPR